MVFFKGELSIMNRFVLDEDDSIFDTISNSRVLGLDFETSIEDLEFMIHEMNKSWETLEFRKFMGRQKTLLSRMNNEISSLKNKSGLEFQIVKDS